MKSGVWMGLLKLRPSRARWRTSMTLRTILVLWKVKENVLHKQNRGPDPTAERTPHSFLIITIPENHSKLDGLKRLDSPATSSPKGGVWLCGRV